MLQALITQRDLRRKLPSGTQLAVLGVHTLLLHPELLDVHKPAPSYAGFLGPTTSSNNSLHRTTSAAAVVQTSSSSSFGGNRLSQHSTTSSSTLARSKTTAAAVQSCSSSNSLPSPATSSPVLPRSQTTPYGVKPFKLSLPRSRSLQLRQAATSSSPAANSSPYHALLKPFGLRRITPTPSGGSRPSATASDATMQLNPDFKTAMRSGSCKTAAGRSGTTTCLNPESLAVPAAALGQTPRLQQPHASGQNPETANASAQKRSAVQNAGVRGAAASSTNSAVVKRLGVDAVRFNTLFLNSALELLGVPDRPPKQLSSAAAVPPEANKAIHRYPVTCNGNRNRSSSSSSAAKNNKTPAGQYDQHKAWNRKSTARSYHIGYSTCSAGPQQSTLGSRSRSAAAAAAAAGKAAAPSVPATSSLRMSSLQSSSFLPECLGAAADQPADWQLGQLGGPDDTCCLVCSSSSSSDDTLRACPSGGLHSSWVAVRRRLLAFKHAGGKRGWKRKQTNKQASK